MFDEGDYYSLPLEMLTCITSQHSSNSKMINKKRFSDEQVRSLETIFENETKLDPKKKVQIAKDLGLQPRQIAIWFQNKRARYKSKELERDYNFLKANYDALLSLFDHLKKEKHALLVELEKLKDQAGKPEGQNECVNDYSGVTNSEESISEIDDKPESNNPMKTNQTGIAPALSLDGSEYGASTLSSDEGSSENTNYFVMGEDSTDLLTMVEHTIYVDNSLKLGELHPDSLFDQSVDTCQWLDFWS